MFSECCQASAWNDIVREEEIQGRTYTSWVYVGVCLECREHAQFHIEEDFENNNETMEV